MYHNLEVESTVMFLKQGTKAIHRVERKLSHANRLPGGDTLYRHTACFIARM